jgi:hypothetical protein
MIDKIYKLQQNKKGAKIVEYKMTVLSKMLNGVFIFVPLFIMLGMLISIIDAFIKNFQGINDIKLFIIIFSIFEVLSGIAFIFCIKYLNQYKLILEDEKLIIHGLFRKEIINLKSYNYCIHINLPRLLSILKLESKNKNAKVKYIIGDFYKEEELKNKIIWQLNKD